MMGVDLREYRKKRKCLKKVYFDHSKNKDENVMLKWVLKYFCIIFSILCAVGVSVVAASILRLYPGLEAKSSIPIFSLGSSILAMLGVGFCIVALLLSRREKKCEAFRGSWKIFAFTWAGRIIIFGVLLVTTAYLFWLQDLWVWVSYNGLSVAVFYGAMIGLGGPFFILALAMAVEDRLSLLAGVFGSLLTAIGLMVAILSIMLSVL